MAFEAGAWKNTPRPLPFRRRAAEGEKTSSRPLGVPHICIEAPQQTRRSRKI
ncbi:hypothetical protein HMPREF0972_00051 [Actinomyces sp. oral taxon 848 str. F0332]|nr:hypothetical protein HMPREF0972_00051 [Actinomyces sp. oral taxon 848 str. F0332]